MCVGNVPAALSEYSRHNVGSVFPGLAVVDGKLKILAVGNAKNVAAVADAAAGEPDSVVVNLNAGKRTEDSARGSEGTPVNESVVVSCDVSRRTLRLRII